MVCRHLVGQVSVRVSATRQEATVHSDSLRTAMTDCFSVWSTCFHRVWLTRFRHGYMSSHLGRMLSGSDGRRWSGVGGNSWSDEPGVLELERLGIPGFPHSAGTVKFGRCVFAIRLRGKLVASRRYPGGFDFARVAPASSVALGIPPMFGVSSVWHSIRQPAQSFACGARRLSRGRSATTSAADLPLVPGPGRCRGRCHSGTRFRRHRRHRGQGG